MCFLEAVQISDKIGEWELHDCFFKRFVFFPVLFEGTISHVRIVQKTKILPYLYGTYGLGGVHGFVVRLIGLEVG